MKDARHAMTRQRSLMIEIFKALTSYYVLQIKCVNGLLMDF